MTEENKVVEKAKAIPEVPKAVNPQVTKLQKQLARLEKQKVANKGKPVDEALDKQIEAVKASLVKFHA
jgi:hypothetical protein